MAMYSLSAKLRSVGVLAVAAMVLPALAMAGDQREPTYPRGEVSLSRELNGRVPGQPVPCITRRLVVETRVIDRTAILFRMPDGTVFVNRPAKGTQLLEREGVLSKIGGTPRAICQNDFVEVHEPGSSVVYERGGKGLQRPGASAQLGEFTPYFER